MPIVDLYPMKETVCSGDALSPYHQGFSGLVCALCDRFIQGEHVTVCGLAYHPRCKPVSDQSLAFADLRRRVEALEKQIEQIASAMANTGER